MKLRLAIVDDTPEDCKILGYALKKYFSGTGAGSAEIICYRSGTAFLNNYKKGDFDAVFLDIFMNDITGIDVGKKLREDDPTLPIVFVTSSDDMYRSAAPVHHFDYIEKPFTSERINSIMNDMLSYIKSSGRQRNTKSIEIQIPRSRIEVPLGGIISAVSCDHSVEINMIGGKVLRSNMRFRDLSELLLEEGSFILCNRGIIVNMEHIKTIDSSNIIMEDGTAFPIRIREKAEIAAAYSQFKMTELTNSF